MRKTSQDLSTNHCSFLFDTYKYSAVYLILLHLMKRNVNWALFSVVILLAIFSTSCRKDLSKVTVSEWNPEFAAPFIKTTIVFSNLFPNDTNLITQEDSSLVYFYVKDSFFNISSDTILEITEQISHEREFSLGELEMEPFGFDNELQMIDILPYLEQSVQDTLLKYDGQQSYFPPFALLESTTLDSEPVENFIDLTFSDGQIIISTTNNLPVSLSNIDFQVIDKLSQNIIAEISIDELASGTQYLDTTNISGLILGNEFSYKINTVSSLGSYPDMVEIDLSKGLVFSFEARDLKIISGSAKITEQLMYSSSEMIDFGLDPEKLKHIRLSSGTFVYLLNSEMNVGLNVNMKLPSALIDGQVPQSIFDVSPNGEFLNNWDISNMSADLSTDINQDYNILPIEIILSIMPTDEIVTFDSSDKINGVFGLEDLKLAYADGYLGQQEVQISEDTLDLNFDFLSQIEGDLILEEPSLTINYTNSIGVPIQINTEFIGSNSESGQSQSLSVDGININSPESPGDSVQDNIVIDRSNSTIVDFLSIRPDQIIYYGNATVNPEGEGLNFVESSSKLSAGVELKIPLILRADHLTFVDTLGFSATSDTFPIEQGSIKLNIQNGFPFELKMSMVLADSITGEIIDKVTFDDIASAEVDADGVVISKTPSEILVEFSPEFLDNMKIANRIYLEAVTSTFGQCQTPVVLYSDYEIEVTISFSGKISP